MSCNQTGSKSVLGAKVIFNADVQRVKWVNFRVSDVKALRQEFHFLLAQRDMEGTS